MAVAGHVTKLQFLIPRILFRLWWYHHYHKHLTRRPWSRIAFIRVTSYQLNNLKGHIFLVLESMAAEDLIIAGSKYGEPINIEHIIKAQQGDGSMDQAARPVSPIPAMGMADVSTYPNPPTGMAQYSNNPSASMTSVANPFQSNINKYTGDNKRNFASAPPSANSNVGGGFYEEPEALQTIANLSPYHNRWAIKARVINKSDVKKFANQKGEGKLFSATCIDNSGEIRMTAFGEAVDKFFDLIEEGQVYFVSNAQVRIAKRQFGVRNEYEIHLEPTSVVTLARKARERYQCSSIILFPLGK